MPCSPYKHKRYALPNSSFHTRHYPYSFYWPANATEAQETATRRRIRLKIRRNASKK